MDSLFYICIRNQTNNEVCRFLTIYKQKIIMVLIRIVFKNWESHSFVTFDMVEAESLVDEYDIKDLRSVHFYPHYNE